MANICILSVLFAFSSCSDENTASNPNPTKATDQLEVTLIVQLPILRRPLLTYSLTDADENNVTTIDVLVFKVDSNDNTKEYFAYKTTGKNISDQADINTKKFQVTLLNGNTDNYRLVVLANAQTQVFNLGEIQTTELKEDVLRRLTITNNGKWITNQGDSNYLDIPMWGESKQIKIDKNTQTISGVNLLRMLARIDVLVDDAAQAEFKLKSIRLYNYNANGYLVPYTDASHWDGKKALLPSIPDPSGKQLGPLLYDQLSEGSVFREIYAFESAAVDLSQHQDATCLVVGGEYNNEGQETFYRIDLVNTDSRGNMNSLNVLRNHLFSIKIAEVKGSGFDNAEEAFNSESANITSEITIWDKGKLTEIVFDKQDMLGISKSTYEFPLSQRTVQDQDNQLIISTDYHGGWVIEKIVDLNNKPVSWLSTSSNAGEAMSMKTISLLLDINDTEKDRVANIHIEAGQLSCTVQVKQTPVPEIGLKITNSRGEEISELLYYSHVGSSVPPQELFVTWIPESASNFVSVIPVAGTDRFNFGTGNAITPGLILGANGQKKYIIEPPAMTQAEIEVNPFTEKTLRIDYTVNNGVTFESKVLFLFQKNYAAVPTMDVNYLMDGTEQYFTINANAPWEIEVTNDPNNIIQDLITTRGGQYEDKRDERVYFIIKNDMVNPTIFNGEVTFTIKPTNVGRPFPERTATIKCYSGEILSLSNSYLIPSSNTLSKSYLIPVLRANEAYSGSIKANDKLEAYLIWTDDANHVNTTIVEPVGRGSSGYLYVYPGTPQGNDVVAVRVDGVIKWSWHLWIVNQDPGLQNNTLNGVQLMDRNIGALNASPANYYSTGLFYQWGRKDPFPPSAGNGSNTNEKIYNKSGQINSIPTSTASNLSSSIQAPLAYFITGSSWSGSDGVNSWINGVNKTIYDPCPPGWRVPTTEVWANLNTGNFTWDATNKGRSHTTAGWFPASGVRARGNSNLTNVGAIGGYWSATFGSPYVPTLDFKNNSVVYNTNYYYIDGATIRCIKE